MDFSLSPEHQALRDMSRRFVETEFPREKILQWVRDKVEPPRETFLKLGELGVFGFLLPPEYSGLDRIDPTGMVVFVEELSRASSALATHYGRAAVIVGPQIARFGSQAQKDLVLPKVARGEVQLALCLTEAQAGSDAAAIATRAEEQPDGSYLINGTKMFNSQIESAGFAVIAARTDPDKPRHEGITLFLVEDPGQRPEIEYHRIETLGMAMIPTYSIAFNDLRLPPEAIIGERGGGWRGLLGGLDNERFYHGAIGVGAAQGIIDLVIDYVNQRVAFGRPLGRLQAVRHKIVDMQMAVDAARLFTYRAAWQLEQMGSCHKEASMAKIAGAEAYMKVSHQGLQLLGGFGYSVESGLPMHFADAKLFEIGGGAVEVQRNIIAKEMGL
ncbi:MAG: acyl-CoA dehydrogenase family protein [Alphaproteobacteria bacterium]|jgi:alkylation response protein AidB-like acyl-CoA dehydrogenase|nr:acyl-CoA dehydrogenase family protein [Alphaproteobacteria bacterium]MDP6565749.1 acyl-CoA dehydrogenase family protein [Alphaproteobacteria bacterium]MDP6815345.1 acyl-CoA dehydrogenase family protein [Alphaproteobacteria bacterium]